MSALSAISGAAGYHANRRQMAHQQRPYTGSVVDDYDDGIYHAIFACSAISDVTITSGLSDLYSHIANLNNPHVVTTDQIYAKERNGFENLTDSTLSVDGSGVFTIAPVSTSYRFWSGSVLYTKTTSSQVTCSNNGENYVYFNTSGVLQVSASPWDITSDNVPVATVYKTASGGVYILGEERHGYDRNRPLHKYLHTTVGARYLSGFGWLAIASASFTLATGIVSDEDIQNTTAQKTQCRHWRRGSTTMETSALSNSIAYISGGNIYYDNATVLTAATAARYVNYYVYGTNTGVIEVVIGQNQFTTIADARSEATPTFVNFNTREWKLLYRVTYQNSGGGTYVENADFREASSLPGGGASPTNASSVVAIPYGHVAATNVQSFLQELVDEKALLAGSASQNFSANYLSAVTAGIGRANSTTSILEVDSTISSHSTNNTGISSLRCYDESLSGGVMFTYGSANAGTLLGYTQGQTVYFASGKNFIIYANGAYDIAFGNGATPSLKFKISSAGLVDILSGNLTITYTAQDILRLYRDTSTAATGIGIYSRMKNASGTVIEYSNLSTIITSSTAGSETGDLVATMRRAGFNEEIFRIAPASNLVRIRRPFNGVGSQMSYSIALLNSSNTTTDYSEISAEIVANSASSESGSFVVKTRNAGTMAERRRVTNDGGFGTIEVSSTPATAWMGNGTNTMEYMKGDKLVWAFKDSGGTMRYFYIDLTLTADQQVKYSATAP